MIFRKAACLARGHLSVYLPLEGNSEGDRAKVISPLYESLAISSELGMRPLVERVMSGREILSLDFQVSGKIMRQPTLSTMIPSLVKIGCGRWTHRKLQLTLCANSVWHFGSIDSAYLLLRGVSYLMRVGHSTAS